MAKKLLDQLRETRRLKPSSSRTEASYGEWMRHFILFHGKHRPAEIGAAEIQAFLLHLASDRNISASSPNQALSVLLFLYREVLRKEIEPVLHPTPRHLP